MQPGEIVKLTTSQQQEISGTVWAHDESKQFVVLHSTGDANGQTCLHFVSEKALAQGGVKKVMGAPSTPLAPLPEVCPVRAKERLEKACKAAEADAGRLGVGVSVLAQQMFDAINKTMPCAWDKTDIVVLDEVRVRPPYTAQTCSTKNPDDTATMTRVQKVLDMEASKSKQ